MASRLIRVPDILRRDKQAGVCALETRTQEEGAVTAEGRIDKILREALGLGLRTDEDGDSEDDPGEAEDERTFPMTEEP